MQSGENDPFILKNFFILDPLHEIYSRKREDTDFFNAYVDYLQYLKYLGIIWKRIKSENIEIGLLHAEAMKLLDTQEQIPEKWKSLEHNKQEMLTVLQLDFESLVIFCRLLLDKVANLIEHLIELPKGIKPGSGFTEHKKAFTKDSSIHPLYSDFLKKRTYWYE